MRLRPLVALAVGAAAAMLGVVNAISATPSLLSLEDRDALTRVAVAEAGNQGDSGIAAVVQTILNRLVSGGWGVTVEAVVDAPHQFEPVARVGGDWRRLPAPTQAQSARVDTILALIADGRMPDFVGGALYFQNPRIVASRIAAGTTPADRLNFGGRAPLAVVGDHAFYGGPVPQDRIDKTVAADPIFIGKPAQAIPPAEAQDATTQPPPTPPERGIFILSNGRLTEDLPRPASDH